MSLQAFGKGRASGKHGAQSREHGAHGKEKGARVSTLRASGGPRSSEQGS